MTQIYVLSLLEFSDSVVDNTPCMGASMVLTQWHCREATDEIKCPQGWGGPDSLAKADVFLRDVINWFYGNKGVRRAERLRESSCF